jgi:hypothetical protein
MIISNLGFLQGDSFFQRALHFGGITTDDYVSMTAITVSNVFTVSFWFKLPTTATSPIILGHSTGTDDTIQCVAATNAGVRFTIANVTQHDDFMTDAIDRFVGDTWYHIVLTRNDKELKCYLNGVEADKIGRASPQTILSSAATTFDLIGTDDNLTTSVAEFTLDELVIWDGTIASAANVTSLYNEGEGALATDVIASPDRYYKMNSLGTSTTATDDGSDAANGTLNNFPISGMWVNR